MSDSFESFDASIKNHGTKGVVLFLKGRGLNDCPMTDRGREILIKLYRRHGNELIPNWPVPDEINDRYYKLNLEFDSGAMVSRLPGSIVQSVLESGDDSFDSMIRGHQREIKVECLKQGAISKDQALGKEVNFSTEYVDTHSNTDNTENTATQDQALKVDNNRQAADASFKTAAQSSPVNESQAQSKGSNKILLIAGLATLALALIAAIIYFLFFKGAQVDTQVTQTEQAQQQTAGTQADAKPQAVEPVVVQTPSTTGKCSVDSGYDSSVIATCAKEGSRDEIIGFIKQAVADSKCESAVNVLLYRARNEKSDPTFAFKLAQFYDSKSSLSLPCLNKDDKAAMYYYDIARALEKQ